MPITSLPGANPHFPSTRLAFLCAFASKFFPMVVLRGSLQGTQCRVPAERQLCCSDTRKSIGPSAPIAYATSVSPPDEAAACRVRRCHEVLSGESCWQRYHEASSGESCWQGCHKASSGRACWQRLTKTRTKKPCTKKPRTKKPRTRSRAQRNRVQEAGHKRSREQKKPCTKKTVHGGECARDGNRTRTDISAHRILSPACLPIPPLEQCKFRLEGQRYYFLSSYEPFLIYFCNLV